jgi:hypothetical protein
VIEHLSCKLKLALKALIEILKADQAVIMAYPNAKPRSLYEKVFESKIVSESKDGSVLLYIGG